MQTSASDNVPSSFRRTVFAFRDGCLPKIFALVLRTLRAAAAGEVSFVSAAEKEKMTKEVLKLAVECLSFDFMGDREDSLNVFDNLSVPPSWHTVRDVETVRLFFRYCFACMNEGRLECATLALRCVVLIASLHRSFYPDESTRVAIRNELFSGTTELLNAQSIMQSEELSNEFCLLLGRLDGSHFVADSSIHSEVQPWLLLLIQFTMTSLHAWTTSPNTKHALLPFWATLVKPLYQYPTALSAVLANHIHQITVAFIESRLKLAEAFETDNLDVDGAEDPLSNEFLLNEQLESIPLLALADFAPSAQWVANQVEENAKALCTLQQTQTQTPSQWATYEHRLAWLIHIISAIIGGQSTNRHLDDIPIDPSGLGMTRSDHILLELVSRVLQLMMYTDSIPMIQPSPRSSPLELAYLSFLSNFCSAFLGEQAKAIASVEFQQLLASRLSFTGEQALFSLITQKLLFNLLHRCQTELVLQKSLDLLSTFATGFTLHAPLNSSPMAINSSRLLASNPSIQSMIQNHSSQFASVLSRPEYCRYRCKYYSIVTTLLCLNDRPSRETVESFLAPLTVQVDQLAALMDSVASVQQMLSQVNLNSNQVIEPSLSPVKQPSLKLPLIQLLSDLRGIFSAILSSETYKLFLGWLFPRRMSVCRRLAVVWAGSHEVINPLLKFLCEVFHNKAQRITFDRLSTAGVVLYREAAQVVITLGPCLLQRSLKTDDYSERYKPIAYLLELCYRAMTSGNVNFAMLHDHQDASLYNSLQISVQLCVSIPIEHVAVYAHRLKSVFQFIDVLTRSHMRFLVTLAPDMLSRLMHAVEEGLRAYEQAVYMQCCNIVESLATFVYSQQAEADLKDTSTLCEILYRFLKIFFEIIMNGERVNTFAVAKPLLPLILVLYPRFSSFCQSMCATLPHPRSQSLLICFELLMRDVEKNMTKRNRDKFQANLKIFSESVRFGSC
eukprot:GILJ01012214.1.p1 GENE.GILJ01012214.1~~GILJ01012214.1.p1  ORF type:complete len:1099 (-),score=157.53 GILJ01012214.1:142-3006(-)